MHKELIFDHYADYRTIRFNGQTHALTRNQAKIIRILHEAFERGTPCVGKATLLAAVESETGRVKRLFQRLSAVADASR